MISSYLSFIKSFTTKSKPKNLLALEKLLSQNLKFYPQYGPGFSNHISMALISLYLMNAPISQFQKFYDSSYEGKITRKQPNFRIPQNLITEENSVKYINNTGKENYDNYFSFFWEMQEKKGLDYTMKYALKNFGKYCAGHLLHPIIRLQFGLSINHTEEIISSLAYMPVKANQIFEPRNQEKITIQQAFKNFQQIEPQLPRQGGFDIDVYLTDKVFQENYREIKIDQNTFSEISEVIIRFFNKSLYLDQSKRINFVVLHMCTGFFALKEVVKKQQQNLGPEIVEKMVQGFLQYFFGVYCLINCPVLNDIVVESDNIVKKSESGFNNLGGDNYKNFSGLLTWDKIVQKTHDSIQEHTIKFVFVCREEAKNNPKFEILYRFAASKRLDLEL